MNYFFHSIIEKYYQKSAREFFVGRSRFRQEQERILALLIRNSRQTAYGNSLGLESISNYSEFREKVPVSSYRDYSSSIEKQMRDKTVELCTDCRQYQPTSGSTNARKWIPYSRNLNLEFARAIAPWLHDIYTSFPGVKKGRHYWSLSWLPDDLREKVSNNDLQLFSWWQRLIMQQTMATPNEVSLVRTSKAAQLATASILAACENLSLLFVWSPTFALNLLDQLVQSQDTIVEILERGNWGSLAQDMGKLSCPKNIRAASLLRNLKGHPDESFLRELWPNMGLISSWESGPSRLWAAKLKKLFPNVPFQGKGLFATEAVVTIPYQGDHVLAYRSHFYEFRCLQSQSVLPSWELVPGQIVSPIVTTGSGFYRYEINDSLLVTGMNEGLPCLEFQGRIGDVDFVGEKMSPEYVDSLFARVQAAFPQSIGVTAFAVDDQAGRPFYLFLFESRDKTKKEEIASLVNKHLEENFHYALAIELGQLGPTRIVCLNDAKPFLQNISMKQGMIEGNIKVEKLMKINTNSLPEGTK